MKNLSKLFSVTMVAMLAVALLVSGCKKDDDEKKSPGIVTVGGNTATFDMGYLEYYGEYGLGVHNFDVVLISSGVNYLENNNMGAGNMLSFEFFVNSASFNGGTFSYRSDDYSDYLPNTFTEGQLIINGSMASTIPTFDHYYEIVGGTVTVTKSGDVYNISYNVVAQELSLIGPVGTPAALTGSYSGSLVFIDESSDWRGAEKKHKFSIK